MIPDLTLDLSGDPALRLAELNEDVPAVKVMEVPPHRRLAFEDEHEDGHD